MDEIEAAAFSSAGQFQDVEERMQDPKQVQYSFQNAMRRLATTICLITTADDDGTPYGMAATAVSSVSMEPPSILTCVNQSASAHKPLQERKKFCINLLHRSHADIVRLFSDPNLRDQRFKSGDWRFDAAGMPVLTCAQASILCDLDLAVPYATHTILIGAVKGVVTETEVSPLLYADGKLRSLGLPLHGRHEHIDIDLVF